MFEFEWDPAKAASNLRKHGVDFRIAPTVFEDPLMHTIRDQSVEFAERWITLGKAADGRLMVVCHTEVQSPGGESTTIRVISARRATRRERRQYEPSK